MYLVILFFTIIPKNLTSRLVGKLARIQQPYIAAFIKGFFLRLYDLAEAEAEHPFKEYKSLAALFTRRLKPESRVWAPELAAPCDGSIVFSSSMATTTHAVVKNLSYQLPELLGSNEPHTLSWMLSIYLAPYNYHRVHAPLRGCLTKIIYIPGELWPVGPQYLQWLPNLYSKNERLVFYFQSDLGTLVLSMVGALNVGAMEACDWPELRTEVLERKFQPPKILTKVFTAPLAKNIGDDLGIFHLGSTVLLFFDSKIISHLPLANFKPTDKILAGASLYGRAGL